MSDDLHSTSSIGGAVGGLLHCSICSHFIVEPVTLTCGDTFCKMCLVKTLQRREGFCPSCREVCHISPEDAQVNSMLKNLAQAVDPEMYSRRLVEHEEARKGWGTTIPIFYYSDPIFPGGKLSLHLFEPRYRLMMQRIVQTTRCFAYVPNMVNYSASIGDIALKAVVQEVEFQPDGRCMLEVKLEGRFRILEHYVEEGTQGLHYCRIEPIEDFELTPMDASEALAMRDYGLELCRQLLHGSVKQKIEAYHGSPPRDVEAFSHWLCGVCLHNPVKRMELLSSQNTMERMQVGLESLRSLINRLEVYRRPGSDGSVNRQGSGSELIGQSSEELNTGAVEWDDEMDVFGEEASLGSGDEEEEEEEDFEYFEEEDENL